MAKKSKKDTGKSKSVKQIPAKVGAKATTKSGDKIEVVLKTTKTIKDASRGSYKPRKNKKQKAKAKEKENLDLLREQIELEKLKKLQNEAIRQPAQRFQNRRTGGDINQFFGKSRNDGTKEVVSELSKEVKSLREELKKSKEEKPVEVPVEEPKSKFVEELETTQNEIQRQRIQRGIQRRDEEQIRKSNQRRIEEFEKNEKQNRLRRERGREATRRERTVNQQARSKNIEQFEKLEKERRNKTIREERTKQKTVEQRLTEREQLDDLRRTIKKEDERRALLKSPSKELTPVRIVKEPKQPKISKPKEPKQPKKSKTNLEKVQDDIDDVGKRLVQELQKEESKNVQQTVDDILGGEKEKTIRLQARPVAEKVSSRTDGGSVPVTRTRRTPTPVTETVSSVSRNIIDTLNNEPLLNRERNLQREEAKSTIDRILKEANEKVKSKKQRERDEIQELITELDEPKKVPAIRTTRQPKKSIDLEPTDVEDESESEDFDDVQEDEPEESDLVLAKRLQEQERIIDDERVARDLLLEKARKEKINDKKIDDMMRKLKDDKQREKKKARDNLRKREQEEFIDETAGEIVRGAVEQNVIERKSKSIIETALGRGLAQEVISATQNIPRQPRQQQNINEKIDDLLFDDRSKQVGRKAYTREEAENKFKLMDETNELKKNISLTFPEIKQKNYSKEMKDRKEEGTEARLEAQIKEDIEQARNSGKYTGLQLVKLETLLRRLRENYLEIKDIEQKKRNRGKFEKETKEERKERIRLELRERERQEVGEEDTRPLIEQLRDEPDEDEDDDDVDLEEI